MERENVCNSIDNKYRKCFVGSLAVILVILIMIGGLTAYIDPYFHYRAPLAGVSYQLNQERYQNDGIAKHFSYDAIIVGSSTATNYKTSELDELFGTNSVKLTCLGATAREQSDYIAAALGSGNDVKLIFRSIDYFMLLNDAETMRFDESSYPTYLYDNNIFNDVNYVLNKSILEDTVNVLQRTAWGVPMTSFDEYSNWSYDSSFGKDIIDSTYVPYRSSEVAETHTFSEDDRAVVLNNLEVNYLSTIRENPDIDFYIVIPTCSIYYWDSLYVGGQLERQLDAEKLTVSELLKCDNVRVFSFVQNTEVTQDLDMFKDVTHFVPEYQDEMMRDVSEGKYEVTVDNADEYFQFMRDFYLNYDYDGLFK